MENPDYLKSELLARAGFAHAFFTRCGGVSRNAFESLNLSPAVGDASENVTENLRRVASALGIAPERLYMTRQVHGRGVIVIDERQSASHIAALEADASISRVAGVACGVRTADCVPILLADPANGRVAAVHAGWRGVAANIGACTEKMALLGSLPRDLIAAFGPHISAHAFEVGEDVAAELEGSPGGTGSVLRDTASRPRVDLARIVRAQLALAGLRESRIEQVEGCTFSDRFSFFSHRRDGSPGGRMLSAIVALDASRRGNAFAPDAS